MNRAPLLTHALPPPDPVYTLRGHGADVTAVCFLEQDTLLASGDVEGHIILWSVLTRRPLRRWRAHTSGILALHSVSSGKLLSHGRDDQLHIWSLNQVPGSTDHKTEPEFTLLVNSLNFCGVSSLAASNSITLESTILLALPGIDENAAIDVYNLSNKAYERQGLRVPNASKDTGLCMCLKLFQRPDHHIYVAAGYESGIVIIWGLQDGQVAGRCRLHEEPVLSLDIAPHGLSGFSGGADTNFGQFLLTNIYAVGAEEKTAANDTVMLATRLLKLHSRGTSVVRVRPDGKIVATGGWDGAIHIYGAKKMKPLAILREHRQGIQCICFAEGVDTNSDRSDSGAVESAASNMFAAGSKDGTITLWQIY